MTSSLVFKSDYSFYHGLPDKSLLVNPLLDVYPHQKEQGELVEFYKLCNEFYSPEFGMKYLLNINLYPFQMAMLRAILRHKFPMLLLTRGGGKTFMLATTAVLSAIMNPGCRIILVSGGFRQSKLIFSEIKRIYDKSPLLRSMSDTAPTISTDRCYYNLNGSSITALPLGQGDKIRGERAHITIVDEFNTVPIDIFDVVVRGFSATEADPWEKTKTLLLSRRDGAKKIVGNDMVSYGNKIILAGTAGYKNDTFYRLYKQYHTILTHRIDGQVKDHVDILGQDMDGEEVVDYRDYCICRFTYQDLPPGMMDLKMILNAKASMPITHFNMEYMTIFGDDTQGFFKPRDVANATSKPNDTNPFSVRLKGSPARQYVIGVDPARTNDRFAISVVELGTPNKLVYAWAEKGQKYLEASKHLRSLIRTFNTIAVVIDKGGGGMAVEEYMQLKELMQETDLPLFRYDDETAEGKEGSKILYMMDFTSSWIEEANVLLQKNIEDKTLMFPCDIQMGDPSDDVENTIFEVRELKRELVSIEVTYTKSGKKHFDLMPADGKTIEQTPKHKDRYTSLLLANYVASRFNKLNLDEDADMKKKYYCPGRIGGYIEEFS